jgi:hypothetical protein
MRLCLQSRLSLRERRDNTELSQIGCDFILVMQNMVAFLLRKSSVDGRNFRAAKGDNYQFKT